MIINIKYKGILIFWGLVSVIYSCILLYILYNSKSISIIPFSVVTSIFLSFILVREVYSKTKLIFTPGFVFLCSYYLFQNGQLLLYCLPVEFNMFYLDKFGNHITEGAVYSSISNIIASYIYFLTTLKSQRVVHRQHVIDKHHSFKNISLVAYQGFLFTGLVAIPLILYKFYYILLGGYAAVRLVENSIPSIINFIEYMFPAFSILSLIYNNHGFSKLVKTLFVIWLLLTALCGDRTTGLAGILVLIYLRYKLNSSRNNKKNIVYLLFGGVALMFLVSSIANFRSTGSFSDFSVGSNLILGFVSELGFSVVPLLSIMDICPRYLPFQNGTIYLESFIGGCIPSFLDPTGTISYINSLSRSFETFQSTYFGLDSFGIGWSLNADSFLNFGWAGLFALVIVNYIIFIFLNKSSLVSKDRNFYLYIVCALLFMWITLPRRDSYYVWKAIIYTVVIVRFYIYIRCPRLRR